MNIELFIQKFADQLEDAEANKITEKTVFTDLDEWSSLTALSIIAMVDEEYDVKITGNDIKAAATVEDLFNIIKSKKL
jgi:acyl carrier protein